MQGKAGEKNIILRFEPAAALPEFIHPDAGKLRQIITNLVCNAIKLTSNGGLRVVTRRQEDADEAMAILESRPARFSDFPSPSEDSHIDILKECVSLCACLG
jgi:signal transduction histidine kinase